LNTLSIPVTTWLNTVARVNNAQVRIAGNGVAAPADTVTIYLDEVRLRVLDALPPTATPTTTPVFMPTATLPASRWMTATPLANEPHNNFLSATDQCAACHRGHTAKGAALRSNTGEEQVCFACHNADVQPVFTAKANTLTRFFSHGVATYTNIHFSTEDAGGYFGGSKRHVECEDCHAPHSTSRTDPSGSVSAPSVQQPMYNSSGVDPNWTVAGAPNSYTLLTNAGREYQVCFKCHSSYTTLPTYNPDGYQAGVGYIANGLFKLGNNAGAQVADSRDLAKEFNSYQVSFHPVAALGRNRNIPAGSFVTGWSQDSMTYCSDCHQNANAAANAAGPHGSSLLHLLDGSAAGSAEYITKTDPARSCAPGGCASIHNTGELCFKCHQYNTYSTNANASTTTNFRNGTENLHAFHAFGSCYTCHDTHGSEQDHLINFDTSVVTVNAGATSQNAWQFDSATGTGTCFLSCHDGTHDATNSYTP
jgi:predicted CXXCH cytochrome family protein